MKAILLLTVVILASCSHQGVRTSQEHSGSNCNELTRKHELAITAADKQFDAAVANFESPRPDPDFIDIADAAAIAGDARAQYEYFKSGKTCRH